MGTAASGIAGFIFIAAIWLAGSVMYCAPTITAMVLKARNIGVVAVINLVFGWTVIGWVVALVFAIWVEKKPTPMGWAPQQPWPQPYPYGQPPQQNWPAQQPMYGAYGDGSTPPHPFH